MAITLEQPQAIPAEQEQGMQIKKFESADRTVLIDLWRTAFPDDPPHNEPSAVIDAKRVVDDLIFVAVHRKTIVGTCMAGYDGHGS